MTKDTTGADAAIAAAMQCLDEFMAAFNARDIEAWSKTFNYPSVRFASGQMTIIEPGYRRPAVEPVEVQLQVAFEVGIGFRIGQVPAEGAGHVGGLFDGCNQRM